MKTSLSFLLKVHFALALMAGTGCGHKPVLTIDRQIAALNCESVFTDIGKTSSAYDKKRLNIDDVKIFLAAGRWQEAACKVLERKKPGV